jgi:hypothetical protein
MKDRSGESSDVLLFVLILDDATDDTDDDANVDLPPPPPRGKVNVDIEVIGN